MSETKPLSSEINLYRSDYRELETGQVNNDNTSQIITGFNFSQA